MPKSTLNMACNKFQSNMPEWLQFAQTTTAAHVSSHAGSRLHRPSMKASSVIKLHEGRRLQAPRLCHATRSSMSPSATPARQSATAPRATNGAQARHQIHPNVFKCHTCHAKRRSMSPRATPATQNRRSRSPSTTPATVPRHDGRLMAPKRATRSNPVS